MGGKTALNMRTKIAPKYGDQNSTEYSGAKTALKMRAKTTLSMGAKTALNMRAKIALGIGAKTALEVPKIALLIRFRAKTVLIAK